MTLIPFIRALLLKLHKKRPPLTRTPESIATPQGYVPYRYCSVKTQPWRPMVSARWHDEREVKDG